MTHRIVAIWNRLQKYRQSRALRLLILLLLVFLGISFIVHHPATSDFDYRVTKSIQEYRNPIADRILFTLSWLGNTSTLFAQAVLAMIVLYWRKHPHAAWMNLFTLFGIGLNVLLKEITPRQRPDDNLVQVLLPTIGMSYPSGHAMGSTMFYGFLAVLSWIHIARPTTRLPFVIVFAALPLLVSFSRLYVGAHWFSDVFGGMTAGLFFLIIFVLIYRRWVTEASNKTKNLSNSGTATPA